jgi:hypothetical protein
MNRNHYNPTQIVGILKEFEQVNTVEEINRDDSVIRTYSRYKPLNKEGQHYVVFKQNMIVSSKYVGRNPDTWSNMAWKKQFGMKHLPTEPFTRNQLFDYCKLTAPNNYEMIVAILAWGGMRKSNANKLVSYFEDTDFLTLITKLRAIQSEDKQTQFTRAGIFNEFMVLKKGNKIPGLGIGYFTKLICFLAPNLKGYIMDQWVSKSINFIYGDSLVKLTNNWVNNNNDGDIYETFCSRIDEIAKDLNCDGFEAEERLFSIGGKKRGAWRAYVIKPEGV